MIASPCRHPRLLGHDDRAHDGSEDEKLISNAEFAWPFENSSLTRKKLRLARMSEKVLSYTCFPQVLGTSSSGGVVFEKEWQRDLGHSETETLCRCRHSQPSRYRSKLH